MFSTSDLCIDRFSIGYISTIHLLSEVGTSDKGTASYVGSGDVTYKDNGATPCIGNGSITTKDDIMIGGEAIPKS